MSGQTQETALSTLLRARLLVGFLGERAQFDWWPTQFFGSHSLSRLAFATPRTARLAQYHGVVEAARRVHDEHLDMGSYHLFRLPEEVEQDLHALMQDAVGVELSGQLTAAKDEALAALKALAGASSTQGEGPVSVGNIDQLWATATTEAIVAGYLAAFLAGTRAYPYLAG
jgi:hypothetical protein